jgi:hypothetical protein
VLPRRRERAFKEGVGGEVKIGNSNPYKIWNPSLMTLGRWAMLAKKIKIPYKITFILSLIHKKSHPMPTYPTITNQCAQDLQD